MRHFIDQKNFWKQKVVNTNNHRLKILGFSHVEIIFNSPMTFFYLLPKFTLKANLLVQKRKN